MEEHVQEHTFDIRYRTILGREKTITVQGTGTDHSDALMDAFGKVEARPGARRVLGGIKRST